MKRYLIILLLAFCCSLSASELYACDGTIYETSLAWQSGNTVAGYSSTELDYCAGIYYDPATWGRFSEGNWAVENPRMISDAYTQGYGSSVAAQINYNYAYPFNGQYYNVDTQHYIISYYQVYVPYWGGGWYWYDPWQLGFAGDWGTYDGPDYYYGIYYASYWVANPQAAGNTFHTIIYSGQDQCPSGQAFTPTGLSCTNPPPPPPPPDPDPPKPTVKIQSVGFKEDAPIKRITDDSLIDDITWERGRNNDDKYPVAYEKGATPKIFGTFKVTNPVAGISAVTVQMKIGSTVYAEIPNVDVSSAGDVSFDNVTLSSPLPNSNITRMTKYDFDWEMKLDGNNKWFNAGESGAHRIYWLPSSVITTAPKFRRNPQRFNVHEQGLYDVGLLHSAGALGNGSDDQNAIAKKITEHLDTAIRYDPSNPSTDTNPLNVFKVEKPKRECGDNATILAALLKTVGVDNTIRTTGGGNTISKIWHLFPNSGNEVSGRFTRPEKVEPATLTEPAIFVEANPHFRYHATVIVGSNSYDPSYGTVDDAVHITKAIDLNNNCITGSAADGARVFTDYRVDEPITQPGELNFNSCGTPSVPRASTVSGVSAPWQTSVSAYDNAFVTMKNTGTETWRASDGYQLGLKMGSGGNLYDAGSFPLPNDVAPDQEVSFVIPIGQLGFGNTGTYDFQWQMMQNTDWFGESTSIVSIYVVGTDRCNQDSVDACMWQGGNWNTQDCSCQGLY